MTTTFLDPLESAVFSDRKPVELANPLSEVAGALRTDALPSLIENLRRNIHRGQRDVRLFEACKDYSGQNNSQPQERRVLVFGATGAYREKGLHDSAKDYDFFAFRGDVEQILDLFELGDASLPPARNPFRVFRANQALDIQVEGREAGSFGSINESLLERYKIKQGVFAAELDLDILLEKGLRKIRVMPRSLYPAVERDISFILPKSVSYDQILRAVETSKGEHLTEIHPFDRYEHPSLGDGLYSFSLRLTFQSHERTLVDEEINGQVERVVKVLEHQLGAIPRREGKGP